MEAARERCPLSSGVVPAFYPEGSIPDICIERCEELWKRAISESIPDHEEYPTYLYPDNADCPHPYTEHGNSSLQSVEVNSPTRMYSSTERCMSCSEEVAEDSYVFSCPNP